MPHDRLFKESYSVEGGSDELFTHYSTIEMTHKKGDEAEVLEEKLVNLKDRPDPLISLYLKLLKTMPDLDSVGAQKRLASEGLTKRVIDMIRGFTRKSTKETLANNIFAPTVTL